MVAQPLALENGENTYRRPAIAKMDCVLSSWRQGLSGVSRFYMTCDNAATTAFMLRLLMAATQMRPESTP